MKILVMLLMVLLLVGCGAATDAKSIPIITNLERGVLGSGEITGEDGQALEVGKLHTVALEGEGLTVVCAVARLPDDRILLIEIELAGDRCG